MQTMLKNAQPDASVAWARYPIHQAPYNAAQRLNASCSVGWLLGVACHSS